MSPIAVQLLRRVAFYSLVVATILMIVPRQLADRGYIGPSISEVVQSAERAAAVAGNYGANVEQPEYRLALEWLNKTRVKAGSGQQRETRLAARETIKYAGYAQRDALVRRDASRRAADTVMKDVDARLVSLEKLYEERKSSIDKPTARLFLAVMRETRARVAALVLEHQQQRLEQVIQNGPTVRGVIEAARTEIQGTVPLVTPTARPPI